MHPSISSTHVLPIRRKPGKEGHQTLDCDGRIHPIHAKIQNQPINERINSGPSSQQESIFTVLHLILSTYRSEWDIPEIDDLIWLAVSWFSDYVVVFVLGVAWFMSQGGFIQACSHVCSVTDQRVLTLGWVWIGKLRCVLYMFTSSLRKNAKTQQTKVNPLTSYRAPIFGDFQHSLKTLEEVLRNKV